MIKPEDVEVGKTYEYPHPSGYGTCRTLVRAIFRPTRMYPNGRVQHEAIWSGWGSVDTMEVFCEHASRPQ